MNSKLFALFGNPVSHSKSPLLHNSLYKKLGLNACYARYLLKSGGALREKFFELGLDGVNVTIPYKEDAFLACDRLDMFAKQIGAVNTIVLRDGMLHGYNTDAPGFIASLDGFIPKKALILGAGGTARALAVALREAGVSVVVANRSEGRLEFFRDMGFETALFCELKTPSFELVVNTTSAGLMDSELPLQKDKLLDILKDALLVYDCIYKHTPLLQLADRQKKKNKNGLDMLIWQAFFAFEILLDTKLDKKDVEVMREAVR